VEQRHAHVADVGPVEVHDHRHPVAGDEEAPLGADDGLRRVGRPRREDETPQRVGPGLHAHVVVVEAAEHFVEVDSDRRHRIFGTGEAA
jgi:hypothetical protein